MTTSRSLSGITRPWTPGRHTGMLKGYQPGDPMVAVFTYKASPAAGTDEIAEEALGEYRVPASSPQKGLLDGPGLAAPGLNLVDEPSGREKNGLP
jgi:hypothetical protein